MTEDFQLFLQANEGRIYFQIQRLRIPNSLHEEFYAEGIVVLWHAYKSFEYTKGDLGTFINYQLRYKFIDLIRKNKREKEIAEMGAHEYLISIDDGNRFVKTGLPIVKTSDITLENELFWREVRQHLTEKQWKWVNYYVIANLTMKEIMEIEHVSKEAIKSWARGARRKLRQKGVWERLAALMA